MVNNHLVGGFEPPLWKIWVRQLGLLFSMYGKKMFQTTNQYKKLGMNEHDSRVSENCEIKVI